MRRALLACASSLTVSWLVACSTGTTRELGDLERMRRQQRYDAYGASGFFANGAAMQPPPAHTVSREASPASRRHDAAAPTDDSARARGARHYAVSCAPCHGAGGFGGGLIAANLPDHRPPSLRGAAAAQSTDARLFEIITAGTGHMPPLGWQLPPAARWDVVAHVRTLPQTPVRGRAAIADSAMADYLTRVDALRSRGAPVESIATLRPPSRPPPP